LDRRYRLFIYISLSFPGQRYAIIPPREAEMLVCVSVP